MNNSFRQELETLIRARYPIVYLISSEEQRVEEELRSVTARLNKRLYTWSLTSGLVEHPGQTDTTTLRPIEVLLSIERLPQHSVVLLKDFHTALNDSVVKRRLRDLSLALRRTYTSIFILAPVLVLPPELEKEITVIDVPLPTVEEIGEMLDRVIESVRDNPNVDVSLTPEQREMLLKAATGLTLMEAENVFARSLVQKRRLDVEVVLWEKEQIIRKSGILEYYRATEAFENVGGLDLLKDWIRKRTRAFTDEAQRFGLPAPKGVLLIGVQGCGKSLAARAIGSLWKLPVLRMDVGRIFAGLVGASEENMRRAIRTAESVAPAVLWIDELEKGFAGSQSSGFSDGGTTARVFASFLTWLQEKQSPVFVVATANDVSALPPELLRKGRFDEIFFIDLPSQKEREEIFTIHLRKRGRDPKKFDVPVLAHAAEGFSGAEIEQAIISALYDAFHRDKELDDETILQEIRRTVPLSRTMREHIAALRMWAADRARPASSPPDTAASSTVPAEAPAAVPATARRRRTSTISPRKTPEDKR
jgi:ATP-dependent 26S proteasome regulatory subunit